jgi:hypothetical protein
VDGRSSEPILEAAAAAVDRREFEDRLAHLRSDTLPSSPRS